jgi:hypothetical protein
MNLKTTALPPFVGTEKSTERDGTPVVSLEDFIAEVLANDPSDSVAALKPKKR